MKEKQFENQVKAFLKEQGCWTLKTWSNGIQRKGVPDLLVCCNGWFLGIELKNEKGKPSALQLWNIEKIREADGVAIVLYPDQFENFKHMIRLLQTDNPISYKLQYNFDRFNLTLMERFNND